MNIKELTKVETDLIKKSLEYYRRQIMDYKEYPEHQNEFRQSQLKRVDDVLEKLRE